MSANICTSCGFANQPNSLYCFRCGVPLAQVVCPNCRSQMPAHLTACPRCGYPTRRERLTHYVPAMSRGQYYTDPTLSPRGSLADVGLLYRLLTKKRSPIYQASPAVYERLGLEAIARSGHYLRVALIVFFIGLATVSTVIALQGLSFMLPASIIGAILPALAFLLWMKMNDRLEPEPTWLVVLAFGWGAFSVLPAIIINTPLLEAVAWAGLAGFTEEPLKMLGIYLIAISPRLRSELNDHLDGLLYGSAGGLGFAFAENILYIARSLEAAPLIIPVRIITMSMHMFTTGLIGYWLGYLRVYGMTPSFSAILPALAFSIFTHMLWNTMAQLLDLAAIIVIGIWGPLLVYYLSKLAREALADEYFWGYAHGYAPREGR